MQLIKKIFNAVLILLGIGVMVVLFCFGLMFLFKVSIFGYTYASQNEARSNSYFIPVDTLKTIDIETNNVSVNLHYVNDTNQTEATVVFVQDFQGVVKDDVKEISYVVEPVIDSNGTLKIALNEPSGLYFKNSSRLSIAVPQSFNLENLNIKTGATGVSFGTSDSGFAVDNLSIISTKKVLKSGVTLSNKLTVNKDIYLETFAGKIVVDSNIGRNVTIKTNVGSIIFNKDISGDLSISGKNPDIQIGELSGNIMDAIEKDKYDPSTIKQVNVNGSISITDCEMGSVRVTGTVNEFVYINAPNLQFWANKVAKGITCASGSNNIRIYGSLCQNDIGRECVIKNGDGHLYINNSYASLKIYASKNGVNIKNAHGDIWIESEDGGTYVSFANGVSEKALIVNAKRGSITAKNITGSVDLNAQNSDVTAEFLNIVGENSIQAKYKATISVADGIVYALTTKAKSASVEVNLGSVTYNNWDGAENVDGWKVKTNNINTTSTDELTNSLLVWVKENGKINVSATVD